MTVVGPAKDNRVLPAQTTIDWTRISPAYPTAKNMQSIYSEKTTVSRLSTSIEVFFVLPFFMVLKRKAMASILKKWPFRKHIEQ